MIQLRFVRPLDKTGLIKFSGQTELWNQAVRDRGDPSIALHSTGRS
jgi:hypothetical protein